MVDIYRHQGRCKPKKDLDGNILKARDANVRKEQI